MYIRDVVGSIARPMRELKGFKVVELNPGESKVVNFEINAKLLEFYSYNNKWEAELGDFQVFVGGSSDTLDFQEFELVN